MPSTQPSSKAAYLYDPCAYSALVSCCCCMYTPPPPPCMSNATFLIPAHTGLHRRIRDHLIPHIPETPIALHNSPYTTRRSSHSSPHLCSRIYALSYCENGCRGGSEEAKSCRAPILMVVCDRRWCRVRRALTEGLHDAPVGGRATRDLLL